MTTNSHGPTSACPQRHGFPFRTNWHRLHIVSKSPENGQNDLHSLELWLTNQSTFLHRSRALQTSKLTPNTTSNLFLVSTYRRNTSHLVAKRLQMKRHPIFYMLKHTRNKYVSAKHILFHYISVPISCFLMWNLGSTSIHRGQVTGWITRTSSRPSKEHPPAWRWSCWWARQLVPLTKQQYTVPGSWEPVRLRVIEEHQSTEARTIKAPNGDLLQKTWSWGETFCKFLVSVPSGTKPVPSQKKDLVAALPRGKTNPLVECCPFWSHGNPLKRLRLKKQLQTNMCLVLLKESGKINNNYFPGGDLPIKHHPQAKPRFAFLLPTSPWDCLQSLHSLASRSFFKDPVGGNHAPNTGKGCLED